MNYNEFSTYLKHYGIECIYKSGKVVLQSKEKIPEEVVSILQQHKKTIKKYMYMHYLKHNDHECLVELKSSQSKDTLLCLHPIGGAVTCYVSLIDKLKSLNVYGLQSPLLSSLSLPFSAEIDNIIELYAEIIKTRIKNKNIYILGWSFGGILANELSCILPSYGYKVINTIMLDTNFVALEDLLIDEKYIIKGFVNDILRINYVIAADIDRILCENNFYNEDSLNLDRLYELFHEHQFLSSTFPKSVFKLLFTAFRAHTKMHEDYLPKRLAKNLTHIMADDSSEKTSLVNHFLSQNNANLKLHTIADCDHYTILQEPAIEYLADYLNKKILNSRELLCAD